MTAMSEWLRDVVRMVARQPAPGPVAGYRKGQAHPLDAAIHSIWLHGDWRWLTKNMTTEEREAAAAAFRRHEDRVGEDEDDQEPVADEWLRWWRY